MKRVEEHAPAKVNLTLHVTGQRADGYHLLDSLVVFADVGDLITVAPARETSLHVTGPQAGDVPADPSNLVVSAAALFDDAAAITLDKRLPVASGIGGGSADAAATVRALARLTGQAAPNPSDILRLGADVPVCLPGEAVRMQGIGEDLSPISNLPLLPAVLVNPGVSVPTPAVFSALTSRTNPAMPDLPERFSGVEAVAEWLSAQRNDLEAPACSLAPQIRATLAALRSTSDCRLARMSGSGATCFGIFPTQAAAQAAAERLHAEHPDWWLAATTLS